MVKRYHSEVKEQEVAEPKRPKREAKRLNFTDAKVAALPVAVRVNGNKIPKQHFVWDEGRGAARGLGVLVNPSGTKTYFATYRIEGSSKLNYKKLGRAGDITVEEAREAALQTRRWAKAGKDPKADDPDKSDSFETVFASYIEREQKGRKQNSSANETHGMVRFNCATWMKRAVATIKYRDIESLLADIRDGRLGRARPATAARLFAHLRDFFMWCTRSKIITENPMVNMPSPAIVVSRNRYYSDDELGSIWNAAEQLDPAARAYVRLMMLLGLRRDELALARWNEFEFSDTKIVFRVPTERVKMKAATKLSKKPVYIVPLPPLAARILRELPRDDELVFPGLNPTTLKTALVREGAPQDFKLHVFRHTIATWLQNQGHSEWERGLVLNHVSGGTVAASYSHGYPIQAKRGLLEKWAKHVDAVRQ